jgi:hypothetical protein
MSCALCPAPTTHDVIAPVGLACYNRHNRTESVRVFPPVAGSTVPFEIERPNPPETETLSGRCA